MPQCHARHVGSGSQNKRGGSHRRVSNGEARFVYGVQAVGRSNMLSYPLSVDSCPRS